MDYLIPTAKEVPKAQFISTEDFPTPLNPLGVKRAGEGGHHGRGSRFGQCGLQCFGRGGHEAAAQAGLFVGVDE
jgi:aerobic carbon-monoxide dehydrogenase large subunit